MIKPTHVCLGAMKEEKLFERPVPALASTSGLGITRVDTLTESQNPLLCRHICQGNAIRHAIRHTIRHAIRMAH
jgi:hypothetical protein